MRHIDTEIAVIGAGSAGLSAACQAGAAGANVLVMDENLLPGGQLFKQIHKFFGSKEHQAGVRGIDIGRNLLQETYQAGVTVLLDSVVYGLHADGTLGIMSGGENCLVKASKIIIATGAKENYIPFSGSTLPGVMGAGAAQTMINVNRVLPGKSVVMMGSGNVGLIVSYQLMQAGADVVCLVDAAPRIGGYGVHASKIRRAGVPIYLSHTIIRAGGQNGVETVTIARVDAAFQPVTGSEFTVDADTVCLAVGLNPMTELCWMAGCSFDFIPAFGGHVPLHDNYMQTTVPGIYVAGDVTGPEEASTAMEEGNLAGIAAAAALGYIAEQEADARMRQIGERLVALRSGPFGESRRQNKDRLLADMKAYQNKAFTERTIKL